MGTLNKLIPIIHLALDKVNRGMPGMMSAVARDSTAESIAIGQEIVFHVTGAKKARDVVPGQKIPDYESDDVEHRTLKITNQKACDIKWTGNELLSMAKLRPNIVADEFQQCYETLMGCIERDCVMAGLSGGLEGGNVIGTAGKIPFDKDTKPLNLALQALQKKKAPMSDLKFVANLDASLNLRNLPQLQHINESGGNMLRDAEIGQLSKFMISESNEIDKHEKGDGSGYLVNASAGIPIGATELTVDTGSGTFKRGDIITIAGDTNKYVVAEEMSDGTVLKLSTPLKKLANDNSAITIEEGYTPSIAFQKSAIWLATRTIPNPEGGDGAKDVYIATDPVSKLSFMISEYGEYHQERIEVAIAWGTGVVKPSNIVTMLG